MRLVFLFLWFGAILKAEPLQVEVSAPSAILMNADTEAILFEKKARIPAYPASVTKVATALFVLDHKKPDMNQAVTVSHEALQIKPLRPGDYPPYWLEIDGTMMGIMRGEVLTMEALLHGLMMVSGNDAANAIAESVSGSIPKFVEELNQYLRSLGCLHTQYQNPHGLHHPEHFTTAYDICLMTKKALQIPKFRELVSKTTYVKPKTNKHSKAEITTFNPMIKSGPHFYPKAIGGKTGWHSKAQATLTTAAVHEGRTLIAVVLGCSKKGRYHDAKKLFEAAFAEEEQERRLVGRDQVFTRTIEGATSVLSASLQNDLSIRFFPAEEPQCRAFVHWEGLRLPIRKGQCVGEVQVVDVGGRILNKSPLIAAREVKGSFLFHLKERVFGKGHATDLR